MRVVTSKFRIMLFLTALYGAAVLLLDPVSQQYGRLYEAVLNFGLVEFLFNRTRDGIGIPVGDRGSITRFVFAVAKTIEFGIYHMLIFIIFNFLLWPIDRDYDDDDPATTLNEFEYHFGAFVLEVTGDERMSYDDDISYALFFPGFLLAAALGYLSVFMTWMVVLTVNFLIMEVILALLRSLPFVQTQSTEHEVNSSETSGRQKKTSGNTSETSSGSNTGAADSHSVDSNDKRGLLTRLDKNLPNRIELPFREQNSSQEDESKR